jgi:hypothetical protein
MADKKSTRRTAGTVKGQSRAGAATSPAKKPVKKNAAAKKVAGGALAAAAPVLVVNIIPRSMSREINQDSEPSLAVNPANPLEIAATAFTPDPMGGALAPIFISTDGGNTWRLNLIVPSVAGSSVGSGDISMAFASNGGTLYGGILRDPTGNFESLRTPTFANPTSMTVLGSRADNDQPFTHAITNAGKDRVYIGNNDFQVQPQTATVDVAGDAKVANPSFKKVRIEVRSTAGQDGPQVRPVAHADGTVYAAFYGWRAQSGSFPGNTLVVTTDVVVVRDDNGGLGASPFRSLTDPGDGLAGRLVARGVRIPFRRSGIPASGQQRLGGTLSIAVDPRPSQSGTVYLAWSDQQAQSDFTLHIRRSTDRGRNWSATDLLTVQNATNAALAINSDGIIGLLYQQLTGADAGRRWKTHLRRTPDGQNWSDIILADTPANTPTKQFDPYLGDYDHLLTVGKVFYGIFSASNKPIAANFPNGVRYQRNADFNSHTLLALDNTTTVSESIDPFFFRVSGLS